MHFPTGWRRVCSRAAAACILLRLGSARWLLPVVLAAVRSYFPCHITPRTCTDTRCKVSDVMSPAVCLRVVSFSRRRRMPHVNGAYRGDFSIERWCQPFWRSGCVHGGCDNRSALITVISSYPMWRDFAMSVNVAGTVSSSLGNEQERRSDEHDGGGEAVDAHGD